MRRLKPPQRVRLKRHLAAIFRRCPHRAEALELLKALLTEAMLEPVVEIDAPTPTREGADDDQDLHPSFSCAAPLSTCASRRLTR